MLASLKRLIPKKFRKQKTVIPVVRLQGVIQAGGSQFRPALNLANVAGLPPDVPMLAKPFRHDDLAAQLAALIDPQPNVAASRRAAGPAG